MTQIANWKMTIERVGLSIKNGGSFHSYVKLPERNRKWAITIFLLWEQNQELFQHGQMFNSKLLVITRGYMYPNMLYIVLLVIVIRAIFTFVILHYWDKTLSYCVI